MTCNGLLPLDQWQRHLVDAVRPGQATYIFDLDLNGDGREDLITGQYWYENSSGAADGPWTRHLIGSPLTDVLAVYDFDGDGDLDIISKGWLHGRVHVYENKACD